MSVVGQVLYGLLWFFIALLWVRFVVDWVQVFVRSWQPRGPLLVALEVVYTITDPPLKAVRKVVPPLRLGTVAIDLSFILVLVTAYLLLTVVQRAFLP